MTAAARFANHALDTRFADLPAAAVQRSKVYVLDSLGVGIAGSSVEGGEGLLRVAAGWGEPAVAVWGRTARLSAPAAAFLNAWQMHNQEYDCLHEGAVVHAMATVLPAALAAAELRGGVSGTELIAAVAVGVDIAAGLGLASQAGFRFFRPGTAGGFGAVGGGGAPARPRQARRWKQPSPGSWRRSAALCRPTARAARSCRPRSRSTRAPRCNPASWRRWGSHRHAAVFEGPYGYLAVFEGAFALEPVLDESRPRLAHRGVQPQAVSRGPRHPWRHRRRHGAAGAARLHRRGCRPQVEIVAPPLIVRLVGRPLLARGRAQAMPACAWRTRWRRCCRTDRSTWRIFAAMRWPIPRRMRWQRASRPAQRRQPRSQRAGTAEPGRASPERHERCRGAARRCSPTRRVP